MWNPSRAYAVPNRRMRTLLVALALTAPLLMAAAGPGFAAVLVDSSFVAAGTALRSIRRRRFYY